MFVHVLYRGVMPENANIQYVCLCVNGGLKGQGEEAWIESVELPYVS